jgi:hypothetical protein
LEIGEFSVKMRRHLSGEHKPFPLFGEVDVQLDNNLDGEEQENEGKSQYTPRGCGQELAQGGG